MVFIRYLLIENNMKRITYVCDHCKEEITIEDLGYGMVLNNFLDPIRYYGEICSVCSEKVRKFLADEKK